MPHIIEPTEDEPLGDLAANLLALAAARGISGPEVVTHGEISAFEVSDELYRAWTGEPAAKPAADPKPVEEVAEAEKASAAKPAKSRKSRKGEK